MTSRERMSLLALSFPILRRDAESAVVPWDAEALDRWACSGGATSGSLLAARFVLSVWDPETEWECMRDHNHNRSGMSRHVGFQLHRALGVWDNEQRAAFVAWAREPWWP